VRWGCFKFAAYRLQHAVEIVENLIVPKPDDAVAVTRELGAALIVCVHPLRMLTAIELDDQLAGRAGEIGDTSSDRMLPPKLPRLDALAQGAPENPLDIRALPAQAPRDQRSRSQWRCHPHLTRPLRPSGAERGRSWHVPNDGGIPLETCEYRTLERGREFRTCSGLYVSLSGLSIRKRPEQSFYIEIGYAVDLRVSKSRPIHSCEEPSARFPTACCCRPRYRPE
jgi:hypothetical protein